MKTQSDILEIIADNGTDICDFDSIKDALEDGALLLELGITDEDQGAVEDAHAWAVFWRDLQAGKMN